MPDDRDQLATRIDQIAVELRQLPPCTDWVAAFVDGDAVGTDEAAFVANCSAQTIRRRAIEAAAIGKPIGVWFAKSVWMISLARLLDAIEEREGRSERLSAMSRAEKYAKLSAPQQNSPLGE